MTRFLTIVFLLAVSLSAQGQFYNGSHQEFGKNRVQYRDFFWLKYTTDRFEVYYYQGGDDIAQYVVRTVKDRFAEVEAFYDFSLDEQIQIIVYNKQSEFRQSNVGLTTDDQNNIGGSTRIVGSKIFIYYEGDHRQLDRQLRQGVSQVLYNQMMYGGDWKNTIKNNTLLTTPEWFSEGIMSYAAGALDPTSEARIRDMLLSGKMRKFNRLNGEEARLAGHSFWQFITERYGKGVVPNILYMTRVSRQIENGFLYVLQNSTTGLHAEFIAHNEGKYLREQNRKPLPEIKPRYSPEDLARLEQIQNLRDKEKTKAEKKFKKRHRKDLGDLTVKHKSRYTYSQFRISPDQSKMAFVTNELGQIKVWIYDFETGKIKRIFKKEYKLDRIIDHSFPVVAWHPSGMILTFTTERNGGVFMHNYNFDDNKLTTKELFRIDKILSMDYHPQGRQIAMSGVKDGKTDLFLYFVIGNNQEQVTNDIYDDLNPRFTKDGSSLIFASNRPDDTLRTLSKGVFPSAHTDIYLMHLDKSSGRKLEQVTFTPEVSENHPSPYIGKNYTFLAPAEGIMNRYVAHIDSSVSRVDTIIHYRYFTVSNPVSNLPVHALDLQVNPKSDSFHTVTMLNGKPAVLFGSSKDDIVYRDLSYYSPLDAEVVGPVIKGLGRKDTLGPGDIDINHYVFEDEKRDYQFEKQVIKIEEKPKETPLASSGSDSLEFVMPKSGNYRLNFAIDYVLSQVDNSFTSQFYQPLTGPNSINPGISGLIKFGISDLFEDYKMVGGIRLSGNLTNNDYGIMAENLTKRLDRRITLQRQGQRRVEGFSIRQYHTHLAEYRISWPFNELMSIRATGIYRLDRSVVLATDLINLGQPSTLRHNAGVRLEFVFDNTINRGLNLFNGTRAKAFAEYYQIPGTEGSNLGVIGFDFRHYQKIHRDLIYAFRLGGNTSFGSRKILHFMGGVDNWLFQRIDNTIPVDPDQGYGYQTLASPMRGFWLNSRNGSTFAIINQEIRFPVFKYALNKPIRSDFIENFQIVGFNDIGSAWTGLNPYSDENTFNITEYEGNPITIRINNNRDPIIYSYGFGLRSRVLGYFVRADWAWGVDDGVVLPRVFHLSLNLDF